MEFSIRFFSASAPIEMKSTRGAFCAFTRKICVHHSFALQALLHIGFFSAVVRFFYFTSFERAMRWQNRAQEKEQQRSFQSFCSTEWGRTANLNWTDGALKAQLEGLVIMQPFDPVRRASCISYIPMQSTKFTSDRRDSRSTTLITSGF